MQAGNFRQRLTQVSLGDKAAYFREKRRQVVRKGAGKTRGEWVYSFTNWIPDAGLTSYCMLHVAG
jgi:hypothetical protein